MNRTTLQLRIRGGFESLDSGILLFRRYGWAIIIRLALILLPTTAMLTVFLPTRLLWTGFVALWWLRPLWDRVALHPISVGYFEPEARGRQLWKNRTRSAFGLLSDLTFARFSIIRCARMPLRVLERVGGIQARRRESALFASSRVFPLFCSLCALAAESALIVGELNMIGNMTALMPELVRAAIDYSNADSWRIILLLYGIHLLFTGPLFTAMGFAFYVNRRATTEGWDLEVAFRERGAVHA